MATAFLTVGIGSFRGAVLGQTDWAGTSDYFAFHVQANQRVTITLNDLSDSQAHVVLEDATGTPLAVGKPIDTNISEWIQNFVIPVTGEYYLEVTGDPGVEYNLGILRGATFDREPNNGIGRAQSLDGTHGALGAIATPVSATKVLRTFDGLNASDNRDVAIEPPDPSVAAGPSSLVTVVNSAIRYTDKSGNVLFQEDLAAFFATVLAPDTDYLKNPVLSYDEEAQRFVLGVIDVKLDGSSDFLYAVSNDADPLDGFGEMQAVGFDGLLADFPRLGWNADAHVISFNMYDPSFFDEFVGVTILSIDKASVLDGDSATFDYYLQDRGFFDFSLTPAVMHDSKPGDPMYFVEASTDFFADTITVVREDDLLSDFPSFTDTEVFVDDYFCPPDADQNNLDFYYFPPYIAVAQNGARILNAEWRGNHLVAAHNIGIEDDFEPHARWYEISTSGSPSLIQDGTINQGVDIATYYPAIAIGRGGRLGLTFMESSFDEFVSMYVTGRTALDPLGTMQPPIDAQPGQSIYLGDYAGDYSSIGVDPSDGVTFWAISEYTTLLDAKWATSISHFSVSVTEDRDWYAIHLNAKATLELTTSTPDGGAAAFANGLYPRIELYDPQGHHVADGVLLPDGRNQHLVYQVPSGAAGNYRIIIRGAHQTFGEYFLSSQVHASGSGQTSSIDATAAVAAEVESSRLPLWANPSMAVGSESPMAAPATSAIADPSPAYGGQNAGLDEVARSLSHWLGSTAGVGRLSKRFASVDAAFASLRTDPQDAWEEFIRLPREPKRS